LKYQNGSNTIAEYDGNGSLKSFFVYGSSGLIAKVARNNHVAYFYKDNLGSSREMSDDSFFADYYPFGEKISSGGISEDNHYQFTGKELDNTGLYYFDARYYDAGIGRWLTPDPLAGKYPGLSPYNYCAGNPLRFVDPDGQTPDDPDDMVANFENWLSEKFIAIGDGLLEGWNKFTSFTDKIGLKPLTTTAEQMANQAVYGKVDGSEIRDAAFDLGVNVAFAGVGGILDDVAKVSLKLPKAAKVLNKFDDVAKHLKKYNGIDPKLASKRLHQIKKANNLGGADNVIFTKSGDIYSQKTKELIGSLTEGGAKGGY